MNVTTHPYRSEILVKLATLLHLQWLFGNVYEGILAPNQVVARDGVSVPPLDLDAT